MQAQFTGLQPTFLSRDNLNPEQAVEIAKKLRNAKLVERQPSAKEQDGRKITVLLDGKDISWDIRGHGIDDLVAKIAVNRAVIDAVHTKENCWQKRSKVCGHRRAGNRDKGLPKAR